MEDFGFYLVMTNPKVGYERCCEAAVKAGVKMVQLRMKDVSRDELLEMAKRLVAITRGSETNLIIDDDASVAEESGADGVHVGQDDMPVEQARALIGPDKILGLTVTNAAEMTAVNPELVDYVGCGPVFPTISKDDAPTELGVQKWGELAATCPVPICAIGGLNVERARAVRATGHCDGIAVVSAICAAENPEQAARELA